LFKEIILSKGITMKYDFTVATLSAYILNHYPSAKDELQLANKDLFLAGKYENEQFPAYLLWMLQELEIFTDREKAARWLGWVMRSLEVLKVVTLQENRTFVKIDKKRSVKSADSIEL